MNFIVIIPTRFASSRLYGKPLVDINGRPMIIHVMEKVQAAGADRVIIATDHNKVAEVVKQAGGEVCLTRSNHRSGTERLGEVINYYGFSNDQIIVNVQGDEPLIPPQIIRQVADDLTGTDAGMATLAVPINTMEEAFNPNIIKVVTDIHGYALYFSRAAIPWNRKKFISNKQQIIKGLLRHIGVYAYRVDFIRRYVSWTVSPLEEIELLEQLRVLWYNEKIHVMIMTNIAPYIGVDTPKELAQVRLLLQQQE